MVLSAFPYPGGKTTLVDDIVQYFPRHRRYVEVFGGSAAVLLNKPPSYIEVYNDLNSDIVHFFETVRDRRDELEEWLRATPYSRELHEEWARAFYDGERPDDDVARAGRWFYLRYTQYGAKIDRYSGFKPSIKRNEARSLRGSADDLDQIVERLQNVTIENQDFKQVVQRYDRDDTLFYLDPPYLETAYNFYGTGQFDHERLSEVLDNCDGHWIVSYGKIPESIEEIATNVEEFAAHYSLDVGDGESRGEDTERLAMNYDPKEVPSFSEAGQSTLTSVETGVRDR